MSNIIDLAKANVFASPFEKREIAFAAAAGGAPGTYSQINSSTR